MPAVSGAPAAGTGGASWGSDRGGARWRLRRYRFQSPGFTGDPETAQKPPKSSSSFAAERCGALSSRYVDHKWLAALRFPCLKISPYALCRSRTPRCSQSAAEQRQATGSRARDRMRSVIA